MVTGEGYDRCPKCNYSLCWGWVDCNNGDWITACSRCGLDTRGFAKYDIERGKQSYTQAEKLVKAGDLNGAIRILEIDRSLQWSDKEKKDEIAQTLKRMIENGFERFYLKDKDGNLVYDEKIDDACIGDYSYSRKDGVEGTDIGAPKDLQDFKERWVPEVKNYLSEAEFTEKRGNTWFSVSLITGKEREIKDDEEEPSH